ncbi:hypothetical protein CsSME_00001191 [Camellia sinensis var. sinensis]
MYPKLIITMGVLLILLLPRDSNASLIRTLFKLAQDDSLNNRSIQVAPSPSPVSSVDSNFGGGSGGNGDQVPPSPSPSPLAEPNDGITDERCEISSSRWCQDLKNMTACLPGSGNSHSFYYCHVIVFSFAIELLINQLHFASLISLALYLLCNLKIN